MAVTLGVMPIQALLNDINPHLVSFYQWLKRGLSIDMTMENDKDIYYAHREEFNELVSTGHQESKQAASLFYYLNRTGYNGLCRFSRKGRFNVPFGKYNTINYVRDFSEYREVFRSWQFTTGPFEQMLLAQDDFIYADPPYDVEFTQYTQQGFRWEDQIRLAEWLVLHPGPVVLSNQATPRILSLYRDLGFHCRMLQGPRFISCTGDRTPAQEVLALRGIDGWW